MIQPDRLTVKAAEALQQAASLARSKGNPVINDAHLFYALLQQDEGIVVPLLQKAGLNVTQLQAETEREIERFPKQSGGADPTLSRELSRVLDRADEDAKSLGDAYVSTEHLLLALAEEKNTTARQLLSAAVPDCVGKRSISRSVSALSWVTLSPVFWSRGTTIPSSCESRARKRWASLMTGLPRARASALACWRASVALTVKRSGLIMAVLG